MKTNSIFKITISLLLLVATIVSCVDDTDFDTPNVACDDAYLSEIPEESITSIQNVLTAWNAENPSSYDQNIVDFADLDANPIYLEGYVTSNDAAGNFYKELFIQDKFENPDYAVKLGIDVRSLYTKYTVGSRILVKLNGLSINKSHGEMTIGENINGAIDEIRENVSLNNILRSCTSETIVPIPVNSSSDLNDDMLGKFIQLTNAQFHVGILDLPYVNPNDSFDSYRDLVFCSDVSSVKLETSTFAAYGETIVPSAKFNISGILSRDYGDDFYVLKLNSTDDIVLLDTPRCDPLFLEGFSGGFDDWTTYSVTGNQTWEIDAIHGNPGSCAKVSGFSGGAQTNEDWLISPAIDLSNAVNPVLTFQTAKNYSGPVLEVFTSNDYTEGQDPTTSGTWTPVTAVLSPGSWSWENSGSIDISSYVGGNLFVAFKYTSSSLGAATFEVDNVSIVEE